jgi:hypothetical protein
MELGPGRSNFGHYSPKFVEGKFCDVRLDGVLRHSGQQAHEEGHACILRDEGAPGAQPAEDRDDSNAAREEHS